MKKLFLLAMLIISTFGVANAQSIYDNSLYNNNSSKSSLGTTNSSVRYQQGYTRSNGTYVQGHYKTNSNSTNTDNFSTSGNINTFTGTNGTRARDYSNDSYNYGSGKSIQTGSRGGQYYVNSHGNKTYVPKR